MGSRWLVPILAGMILGACDRGHRESGWQVQAAARSSSLAESLASRSPQVIMLGDSIAECWQREGAASWERLFEPLGAMNLGIGGERTFTLEDRLRAWPRPQRAPHLVLLHVGTNDTNEGPVEPEELAGRILDTAALVDSLWGPQSILISALLPRDGTPTKRRSALMAANDILGAESRANGYFFADPGARFVAADGSIPEELMYDALHLTPEGYRLWAGDLEPIVRAALHRQPAEAREPGT